MIGSWLLALIGYSFTLLFFIASVGSLINLSKNSSKEIESKHKENFWSCFIMAVIIAIMTRWLAGI